MDFIRTLTICFENSGLINARKIIRRGHFMTGKIAEKIPKSCGYLFLLAVLGIVMSVVTVAAVKAFGYLTDNMAKMGGDIWRLSLMTMGLFALQCILEYGYYAVQKKFTAHGVKSLTDAAAKRVALAEMMWINGAKGGDITGRIQSELPECTALLSETLPDAVLQLGRIILFAAVIFAVDIRLALIFIGTIVCVIAVQTVASKPMQSCFKNSQARRAEANSLAGEIIGQRETVKVYNAHSVVLGWYSRLLKPWFDATVRAELTSSPLRTLGWVMGVAPTFILCISGAYMVQNGLIDFAAFMSVYFLADTITNDCMHFVDIFIRYRRGKAAAERFFEILEAPLENQNKGSAKNDKAAAVVFENVTFSYDQGDVLKNLSFEIKKGEKVAFVGPSGCGKSTVLALVQGLYPCREGRVTVEGRNTADTGCDELRENMALTPQSPFLFSDTLKNNVTLWKDGGDIKDIYEKSDVSSFLPDLESGENTLLGEGGVSLSGGQKQRVAVARTLYKKAGIVLLDEATSALDALSDKKIFETVSALPDATVIAVTHRLSNLESFDRIYVMDGGKIAEQGNHRELMDRKGLYFDLFHGREEGQTA